MDITLDTSAFNKAMLRMVAETGVHAIDVTKQQAQLFVKGALKITPPITKVRGERSIRGDLRRIFEVITDSEKQSFIDFYNSYSTKEGFGHKGAAALGDIEKRILSRSEMEPWHASRRKSNGRVMGVRMGRQLGNLHAAQLMTTGLRKADLRGLDVGLVSKTDFNWFVKEVQKKVGMLAGGWAAAAITLGVRVPDWIARHGTMRGTIRVVPGKNNSITIENGVKFATNVRGFEKKLQAVLNFRTAAMTKMLDFLVMKHARAAGFY